MRTSISLLFTLTLFFNSFFSQAFATESGANKVFTLGVISTRPKKTIKATMLLVNYIVSQMPEYDTGKVFVTESVEEMSDLLQRGEVSMLVSTPYAVLLIERQGSAK
jgi:hypothetical protein